MGRPRAVVIGASAGGVEALAVLLPALPQDLAVPILIVLHQPRHRPSMIVDIFSARCRVPVREAEDKDPIVAGTIYFAPPDYHLLVDRGDGQLQLALSADAPVHFSRPSVDVLFESAADAYGAGVAGVILTGASSDGALGLAAIVDAGGRAIVQDPAATQVPLMPQAALHRVPSAEVRTLEGIAAWLATLGGRQ